MTNDFNVGDLLQYRNKVGYIINTSDKENKQKIGFLEIKFCDIDSLETFMSDYSIGSIKGLFFKTSLTNLILSTYISHQIHRHPEIKHFKYKTNQK